MALRTICLAASLHPTTHKRNPAFSRFLKRYDLAALMRPYPNRLRRQGDPRPPELYRRLCEIIWDPARLGFAIPNPADSRPAPRTRASYRVDIPQLVSGRAA